MKYPSRQHAIAPSINRPVNVLIKSFGKLRLAIVFALWLLTAFVPQALGQQPEPAPAATPASASAVVPSGTQSDVQPSVQSGVQSPGQSPGQSRGQLSQSSLAKRQEAFQIVWQTVNDQFYDTKFGGVDWAGARKRYEPLVAKVVNDQQFHLLLQAMLNELHQSHFLVIPREAIPKIRVKKAEKEEVADAETADAAEAEEEALDSINYKVTDQLLTGIGIDLRVLGGSAVVTRVDPGSSAARAGLRPGFVIKQVGGRSLDTVIAEIEKHPLWGAIIRPELPTFLVAGFINGELTSPLSLRYLDARNRLRTVSIKRERLTGEMSPAIGNLPALYTEFESKRLASGIGYIRFNAFVPLLMEKFCGALRTMKDAPGIVIDLRGNQGGMIGMIAGLGGLLETTPTAIGTMETRGGRLPLFMFPQNAPYNGPLVILLDGSTQSAGEMFASGLQEAGRATLIGERSAGNTLPSGIKKLPTGALFQYGLGNYETPSGLRLEGVGIDPDITVKLSRQTLLRGGDPQLAAGVRELRKQIRVNAMHAAAGAKAVDVDAALTRSSTPPVIVMEQTIDADPPPEAIKNTANKPPPPPAPMPPPRAVGRDARESSSPETRITVLEPPPPPPPSVPPVRRGVTTLLGVAEPSDLPTADAIFDKYVVASGGQAAFEKITSRVSTGTVEMTALSMTGKVEFDEQAPNRSTMIMDTPGLGVTQRTFDGRRAWLQDPLVGFINLTGLGVEIAKSAAAFNKQSRLKELYPYAKLVGKEKLNGKDVFVVRMGFEMGYFDAESGLLLRKGNIYYDDYREVDGVKLPFKIREEVFSGVGLIFQLTEIKHNVSIDEAKFKAYPSCFTKP
jgi:carboxyl-terminal processing protease